MPTLYTNVNSDQVPSQQAKESERQGIFVVKLFVVHNLFYQYIHSFVQFCFCSSTYDHECPVYIKVHLTKMKTELEIYQVQLKHANHPENSNVSDS